MIADEPARDDRARWSPLLHAVAERQDKEAFAALFDYFAPRVKAFMRRSGASDAQAEELAQETMLTVWRKSALFDPSTTGAAAWIFTIARNLRIDAKRRELRAGIVDGAEVEREFEVDDDPQPDARLATKQVGARVREAMTRLSPDQVNVIELSFFEEKAHAEIARTLGIPLGTVKSRLRLAMNRLRTLLNDLS